ncbi:MAG: hypothetical protein K6F09_06245 [Clostridiales bacterium]|nr:hypothetical protein [Clostridiales bacterium]
MTKIIFSFDAEDYTDPSTVDAILRLAAILEKEGIRGGFNMVGRLAEMLMKWGRRDVTDALRRHLIGIHSLGHTMHPMINEYSDIADWERAVRLCESEEGLALENIRKAFGINIPVSAVPPGNQQSYASMIAYAEMGVPIYTDSVCDTESGTGCYYGGMFHLSYAMGLEKFLLKTDDAGLSYLLDKLSGREYAVLYIHPHRCISREAWDILNFDKRNIYKEGHYLISQKMHASDSEKIYSAFSKLIKLIKRDERFLITDFEETAHETDVTRRRGIGLNDIPEIKTRLEKRFYPVTTPESLSLADIFKACAEMLKGGEFYECGFEIGPMFEPYALKAPETVKADDVIRSAFTIDPREPVPEKLFIGDLAVGPADWLYAALEVLTGAKSMVLFPREQLPTLSAFPELSGLSYKGTWRHSDDFEDNFVSDRVRYMSWSMRMKR